jgi:hypothetical protein
MAEYLEQNIEDVKNYVQKNYTFRQISDIFKQHFPGVSRGFSERNIRLFCSKRGIRKLNNFEVDTTHYSTVYQWGIVCCNWLF